MTEPLPAWQTISLWWVEHVHPRDARGWQRLKYPGEQYSFGDPIIRLVRAGIAEPSGFFRAEDFAFCIRALRIVDTHRGDEPHQWLARADSLLLMLDENTICTGCFGWGRSMETSFEGWILCALCMGRGRTR